MQSFLMNGFSPFHCRHLTDVDFFKYSGSAVWLPIRSWLQSGKTFTLTLIARSNTNFVLGRLCRKKSIRSAESTLSKRSLKSSRQVINLVVSNNWLTMSDDQKYLSSSCETVCKMFAKCLQNVTYGFYVPQQDTERRVDLEIRALEFENFVQIFFYFFRVDWGQRESNIIVFYSLAQVVHCAQGAPKENVIGSGTIMQHAPFISYLQELNNQECCYVGTNKSTVANQFWLRTSVSRSPYSNCSVSIGCSASAVGSLPMFENSFFRFRLFFPSIPFDSF